ncbi:MAG: PHP domain-containing protein [Candidatus Nanoarchaeia archaeon]|nr:PHP domain-containing protein [Candidatus Nanoarchaeia archaeon]
MKIYFFAILGIILIIILGLNNINYFSINELKGQGYYIGNLHTHTIASDGENDYNQMVMEAVRLGFDFIAITDHSTISSTALLLCPLDKRILCILGEEVSTLQGHVVALGITKIIPSGLNANETINLIHEQNGLAIAAHPGIDLGLTPDLLSIFDFDAVECNSALMPNDQLTGCNNFYIKVYNSDAHNLEMLRTSANNCTLANLTWQAIKESILAETCSLFSSII